MLLAGPVPPNPTELLARENLSVVFDLLKEKYDYIVLDTAPIGLVSDTFQIGKYSDVSIMVIRSDYTPKASIPMFNNISAEKKLPNVCLVLNGVDMSKKK
jgi:Mrp family chromosome partitioning ATPase